MNPKEPSRARAETVRELFDTYQNFKRAEIISRRFTQAEMIEWLRPMVEQNIVQRTPLGMSAEGREIAMLGYGKGPVKVLLWSQMHGDEPTATMALLDILNFFAKRPDHSLVETIRNGLTLLIVPMLNPDGAERFTRRTAQLVDMNRDAVSLSTPEANILRNVQKKFRPDFGFNLHDQDPRYTVGTTKEVAAIALLAPAMNESREDNDVRSRAKNVASVFAEVQEQLVPGHTAKYDDAFEPRAFGDGMQQWGTSTVLVESGGWPNDRDKMFIRKLNYVGLLVSLYAIAAREYERQDPKTYEKLPLNTKNLYDVIVRNIGIKGNHHVSLIRSDVAFNIEESKDERGTIRLMGKVVDLGDLSRYGAFEERTGEGKVLSGTEVQLDQTIPWEKLELLLK